MNQNGQTTSINQKIFTLDLCVETVSAYLLCCGIADAGSSITTKNLLGMWNSTRESLDKGLQDLESRNIICRIISDREEYNIYRLTDADSWKQA